MLPPAVAGLCWLCLLLLGATPASPASSTGFPWQGNSWHRRSSDHAGEASETGEPADGQQGWQWVGSRRTHGRVRRHRIGAGVCGASSAQETGFISVGDDESTSGSLNLFYWLARHAGAGHARTAGSPAPADSPGSTEGAEVMSRPPLVVWLSGMDGAGGAGDAGSGPGGGRGGGGGGRRDASHGQCSSLLSLFNFAGPCTLRSNGLGEVFTVPSLHPWTSFAHVLWIELPGSGGFTFGKWHTEHQQVLRAEWNARGGDDDGDAELARRVAEGLRLWTRAYAAEADARVDCVVDGAAAEAAPGAAPSRPCVKDNEVYLFGEGAVMSRLGPLIAAELLARTARVASDGAHDVRLRGLGLGGAATMLTPIEELQTMPHYLRWWDRTRGGTLVNTATDDLQSKDGLGPAPPFDEGEIRRMEDGMPGCLAELASACHVKGYVQGRRRLLDAEPAASSHKMTSAQQHLMDRSSCSAKSTDLWHSCNVYTHSCAQPAVQTFCERTCCQFIFGSFAHRAGKTPKSKAPVLRRNATHATSNRTFVNSSTPARNTMPANATATLNKTANSAAHSHVTQAPHPFDVSRWIAKHKTLMSRRRRARKGEQSVPFAGQIRKDLHLASEFNKGQITAAQASRRYAPISRTEHADQPYELVTSMPDSEHATNPAGQRYRGGVACHEARHRCASLVIRPVEKHGRSIYNMAHASCTAISPQLRAAQLIANTCLFSKACVACKNFAAVQHFLRLPQTLGALGGVHDELGLNALQAQSRRDWAICGADSRRRQNTASHSVSTLTRLVREKGLRVLFYTGEADAASTWVAAEATASDIAPVFLQNRREWRESTHGTRLGAVSVGEAPGYATSEDTCLNAQCSKCASARTQLQCKNTYPCVWQSREELERMKLLLAPSLEGRCRDRLPTGYLGARMGGVTAVRVANAGRAVGIDRPGEMHLLAKLWLEGNKFATARTAAPDKARPQHEAATNKRKSASIVSAIISRAKKATAEARSSAALEAAAAMERKRLEKLYGTQAPTPAPTPAPAVVVVSRTHAVGAYPFLLPNAAHPRNIKRDAMACQRQCELLVPCRYGTFIAGGEHRGECWLSANARPAHKEKLCGFPCISFAKQAYQPPKTSTQVKRKTHEHKTWMQRAMQRIKRVIRAKTPTPQPRRSPTPRPTMLTMKMYRERMQRQKMEVARKARKRQQAEERARDLRQRAQAALALGFRAVNASGTEQWATWPYCFHGVHMTFAQCAEHCLAINECVYGTLVTAGSLSGSCFLASSHGTAEGLLLRRPTVASQRPQKAKVCTVPCASFVKRKTTSGPHIHGAPSPRPPPMPLSSQGKAAVAAVTARLQLPTPTPTPPPTPPPLKFRQVGHVSLPLHAQGSGVAGGLESDGGTGWGHARSVAVGAHVDHFGSVRLKAWVATQRALFEIAVPLPQPPHPLKLRLEPTGVAKGGEGVLDIVGSRPAYEVPNVYGMTAAVAADGAWVYLATHGGAARIGSAGYVLQLDTQRTVVQRLARLPPQLRPRGLAVASDNIMDAGNARESLRTPHSKMKSSRWLYVGVGADAAARSGGGVLLLDTVDMTIAGGIVGAALWRRAGLVASGVAGTKTASVHALAFAAPGTTPTPTTAADPSKPSAPSLFAVANTAPAVLFEIDPYPVASAAAAQAAFKAGRAVERRERELRVRGCLALKQGEDGAVALASDPRPPSLGGTGDVFVGTSTDPATIVRISVSKKASSATARLVRVASVQLKLGQAFVAGLHADGEFVYAATFTVPARVVKIDARDPRKLVSVHTVTLSAGHDNACGLAALPESWWRRFKKSKALIEDNSEARGVMVLATNTAMAQVVALNGYHGTAQ